MKTMRVFVNQTAHELNAGSSLAEALSALGFKPPYAVALNLHFVPRNRYAETALKDQDQIEVISPVTGG
jgi:sulfur carrier protein